MAQKALLCAVAALATCTGACSSSSASPAPPGADAAPAVDAAAPSPDAAVDAPPPPVDGAAIIAARPYTLHVPASYNAATPTPLVVMFHGYSVSGAVEEGAELHFTLASDAHGFLYAYGDGTTDSTGNQFWNATDGCCNFDNSSVDDVAYFDAIVQDVAATHNVDMKRVYVLGHSNGGFMAHRLACDRASTVAAIVSLEGAQWHDATRCQPSRAVPVVEIHGDQDMTIVYDGGAATMHPSFVYPSAPQTVATWASKNGCTGALAPTGATLDLEQTIAGSETVVAAYGGCPGGVDVQLWTVQGGGHIPSLNKPVFDDAVWGFFSSHAKP